ncbi:MAG: NAD(P)-binding domain-containing protein, partial [Actinomycetota bacterium]|nr:NAD(P)-binding domain-containing protein [Actinomycetota bacterium]
MKVGVIGLGYVGLPLAVAFAEAAAEVVGVDVSEATVDSLSRGESTVEDIASERLAPLVGERLVVTTDPAPLAECDAIVICVPTPLAHQREPDLSYVDAAGRTVAETLRPGQLVVLESTTYPGTTRERLAGILEESGLVAGQDFNLAFSPERIDPGRTDYTVRTTPKVVGGLTEACRTAAK